MGFHFSCCLVCHFFIFYFLGTFATYSFLRGRINKSYTYSLLLLIISETSTFMSYNFSYYLFNDGSILKYMQIWTCQMKMVDMYSWARINSVSTNDGEKLYETHFQWAMNVYSHEKNIYTEKTAEWRKRLRVKCQKSHIYSFSYS